MRSTVNVLSHDISELNLECLLYASIIAAASRDGELADDIADAAVKMASQVTADEEIYKIFQAILQAAASYEEHDIWFKWLEETLTNVAINLPGLPHKFIGVFRDRLDEIAKILPTSSWFQIRARSISSSGIA